MTPFMIFQAISDPRIFKTQASSPVALQAGILTQKLLQHFLKLHLLRITAIIVFLLLKTPGSITAQEITNSFEARFGLGVANQKWMPYGSRDLLIKGETLRNPFVSVSFIGELNRLLVVRTGMAFKVKGTYTLETLKWQHFPPRPSSRNITTFSHPALSAIGALLFFPYGNSAGKVYLSSGLSIDYLLREKPKMHEVFPYNVDVHFNEHDYMRTTVLATFGVGFELVRKIFIEFEYAPAITSSMNVRQMQIKDSFYSVSLVLMSLS